MSGEQFAEVGIGRDQYSLLGACRLEHFVVDAAGQAADRDVFDVMTSGCQEEDEPGADALIEQEPHAGVASGTCRSLTASAANCKAARTSAVVSCG